VDFVVGMLVSLGGCHTRLRITNRPGIEAVGAGVAQDEVDFPVFIAKEHRMGMAQSCEDYGEREHTFSPTEEGCQCN
jgi:hypothetical protein